MNLDWGEIATALGIATAVVSIGGTALGLAKAIRKLWNYTLGQRRSQQSVLDQLAVRSTRPYVDNLLGVPQFARTVGALHARYYRLPGCWVCVWFADQTVDAFAITVTKKRLWVATQALTHHQLKARLGHHDIQSVTEHHDKDVGWLGARRMGYARQFYFGNPGAYQAFWLSYNDAGVGELEPAVEATEFGFGPIVDSTHPPVRSTANTLTVVAPESQAEVWMTDAMQFGVDLDTVRLAVG